MSFLSGRAENSTTNGQINSLKEPKNDHLCCQLDLKVTWHHLSSKIIYSVLLILWLRLISLLSFLSIELLVTILKAKDSWDPTTNVKSRFRAI
jgi:hypothetical protein